MDPFVIAVGADDPNGSLNVKDGSIPAFASVGNAGRHVDVIAPAVHVLGLRDPGSYLDAANPSAVVGGRFFRGSGTSQGAAIVSGAAALMVQRFPDATPDQIKRMLMNSATALDDVSTIAQGAGVIQLERALQPRRPVGYVQRWLPGTGLGSLEAARGNSHVTRDGVTLIGERDIFGRTWNPLQWAPASLAGTSWSGGTWNGSSWSGSSWSGTSWSGSSWSGTSWSGTSWSGTSWSGSSWSGMSWSGTSWSGTSWSGTSWSGTSWSGTSWSGTSWASALWS
jgi:serine protease AprX